jgi:hypothetical protein
MKSPGRLSRAIRDALGKLCLPIRNRLSAALRLFVPALAKRRSRWIRSIREFSSFLSPPESHAA